MTNTQLAKAAVKVIEALDESNADIVDKIAGLKTAASLLENKWRVMQ